MEGPVISTFHAEQTTSFYLQDGHGPTEKKRVSEHETFVTNPLTSSIGLTKGTPRHNASYGVGELTVA